ncbi:transposase domain-containing protein [Streptomyces sp. NPDC006997]|uniref:transposase domain-containing protein n=1 Tax=Streptomyces sp. NPDC006997 TaxID=3155356 RepID=UPI0033DD79A0
MPRAGQTKTPPCGRLPDRIAVGLLVSAFPPALVDRAVADCGRTEQRSRLLPARVVVYFVLAICLFSTHSYSEVAHLLTQGMAWSGQEPAPRVPTTAAITRARDRLGTDPLKALFTDVARRAPARRPEQARLPWRVRRLSHATFSVPDSAENRERYGFPSPSGPAWRAYPQVGVVTLAEQHSGTLTHAEFAPAGSLPAAAASWLPRVLTADDLVLVDDCGARPQAWPPGCPTGGNLVWRAAPDGAGAPVTGEPLPDGSCLTEISGTGRSGAEERVTARVIVAGGRDGEGPGRLLTTVLDHQAAPAAVLAALFHRRCGSEHCLQQWRTRVCEAAPPTVLRSRWPEGVEQELWGYLLVHHAVRSVLCGDGP